MGKVVADTVGHHRKRLLVAGAVLSGADEDCLQPRRHRTADVGFRLVARPISGEDEAELGALDPLGYPATRALIPAFKTLDADATFDAAVASFIDGVAARCGG